MGMQIDSPKPGSTTNQRSAEHYRVQVLEQDWTDSKRNRTLPVKIYYPANKTGPSPVIIFSHGLGGSRDAASYLGRAWAEHGYVGIFLQHPGSDRSLWQGAGSRDEIYGCLKKGANGKESLNRVQDVSFAIDHLATWSSPCPVDTNAIGMAGHSFGAVTSLKMAGVQAGNGKTYTDPRIKAAVYLSPGRYLGLVPAREAYSGVKIPGMIFTGSLDSDQIINSTPEDRAANFDFISAPEQYLIFYEGAAHQTFGGRRRFGAAEADDARIEKSVADATCHFFDAYLQNDKQSLSWLKGDGLPTYLGDAATFKRK